METPPLPSNQATGDETSGELSFPFGDGGCFGCSKTNAAGLQLRFFLAGDEVTARCRIADRFHGAPGVAHGGIVATVLDEVSCAAAVFVAGTRVVTGELTVRYERPCPVERDLVASARIVRTSHPRYLEIEGEVRLDGELLVCSKGKFFRQAA